MILQKQFENWDGMKQLASFFSEFIIFENKAQSDREQRSVMHNTKNYDKPRGQPPEPLHKLQNNRIKDHHLRNIRETKIAQLLYKSTHHRKQSHTTQTPAAQNNKKIRPQ